MLYENIEYKSFEKFSLTKIWINVVHHKIHKNKFLNFIFSPKF